MALAGSSSIPTVSIRRACCAGRSPRVARRLAPDRAVPPEPAAADPSAATRRRAADAPDDEPPRGSRSAPDGIGPTRRVEIVALTADDVDLALPLLNDRVRFSPATLRGLVDRWDAAGRPTVRSVELPAVTAGYDPITYWERLHHRGDLSTVGQSGMSPELNAWLYRALEANLRQFLRRHAVTDPLPSTAFDVGTGIGHWVRFWRSMGIARVDGCDFVPAAVAAAGKAAKEVGAEGEYWSPTSRSRVLDGKDVWTRQLLNVLLHLVDDDAFRSR